MNHSHGVERAIERLAAKQCGVFARRQAIALGASRRMVDVRIRSGAWVGVLPSTYRVAVVPPSHEQLAMAAVLWSGPDGFVSHAAAAALWRFDGVSVTGIDVTVPATRSLRSDRISVHRVRDLIPADVGRVGPIAVTSALRTAIDLAGVVEVDALEIAIESGLRRRLFSVGQLRWRASALSGTGRRGSTALRGLIAGRDVGRSDSAWEVRAAQLLARSGLGRPVRQHSIRLRGREIARVDLAYPEHLIAVEYDSDQWHSGVDRRHRDAARRNRLRSLGWTVIEVTPGQLRDPTELLDAVRLVLAA
jgi:very-short-patch-repair endonuclease